MNTPIELWVVWNTDTGDPVGLYTDEDEAHDESYRIDNFQVAKYEMAPAHNCVVVEEEPLETILGFLTTDPSPDHEPSDKPVTTALNRLCEQTDNDQWKQDQ